MVSVADPLDAFSQTHLILETLVFKPNALHRIVLTDGGQRCARAAFLRRSIHSNARIGDKVEAVLTTGFPRRKTSSSAGGHASSRSGPAVLRRAWFFTSPRAGSCASGSKRSRGAPRTAWSGPEPALLKRSPLVSPGRTPARRCQWMRKAAQKATESKTRLLGRPFALVVA